MILCNYKGECRDRGIRWAMPWSSVQGLFPASRRIDRKEGGAHIMKGAGRKTAAIVLLGMLLLAAMLLPAGIPVQAKPVLNKTSVYMAKGDTLQLKVKGYKASKVKWSSSNKKVATVDSKGLVKAKKNGKTTITAAAGKKKLKCTVIVEKKTVNRARKLRDYVLQKGKKDKESGLIVLKRSTYDEGSGKSYLLTVGASKKNKKMTFTYYCTPEYPEDPYEHYDLKITIDLISGKSAIKKGTITYRYDYAEDFTDRRYEGTIVTALVDDEEYYTTVSKYSTLETKTDPNTGEETHELVVYYASEGDMNDEREMLSSRARDAFTEWNAWFKSIKGLKKYGISMKAIGFELE